MYNILDLLKDLGITPRKVSTGKHGVEYHSSCPVCGDGSPRPADQGPSDRFICWPERKEGGYFSCRRCQIYGDNIQFVRDTEGKSYPEACAILGIELKNNYTAGSSRQTPRPPVVDKQEFIPHTYDRPHENWMAKAQEFVLGCHEQLMGSPATLQWLAARGISIETVITYKLGYNPGNNGAALFKNREAWGLPEQPNEKTGKNKPLWLPIGLVIPMLDQHGQVLQLRIRRTSADRKDFQPALKYYVVSGGCQATMVLNPDSECFAVVEAGLDAMLVAQEAIGLKTGAITIWNASAKPDQATVALLKKSMKILVGLDDDKAGHDQSKWWLDHFRQARRHVPVGGKDPGEMFANGTDIRKWLLDGLPPAIQLYARRLQENVTLAPNSLVLDQRGEGELEEKQSDVPGDILALHDLMQRYKVRINKDGYGDIRIHHLSNCKSIHAAKLCDLVWMSDDVADLLDRHHAGTITAGNLMGAM